MSLETRLQKLEKARGIGKRAVAIITTREGESMEQAEARYVMQHPPDPVNPPVYILMDLQPEPDGSTA